MLILLICFAALASASASASNPEDVSISDSGTSAGAATQKLTVPTDLSRYDTHNISECLAIAPIPDKEDPSIMIGYDVVGISSCLSDAVTKFMESKKSVSEKIDDLDTANSAWPGSSPGNGGWNRRARTADSQIRFHKA